MKSILIQAAWFCILLASFVTGLHAAFFDVMKFGAKGDGKADDSKAFTGAWGAACKAPGANTITAAGKFMAGPIWFQGPCKGPITIDAQKMNLLALPDPFAFKGHGGWVTFSQVIGVTINGGIFDGNGATTWNLPDCGKNGHICPLPANLQFNAVTGLRLIGLTNRNSKQFHLRIGSSKDVTIERYTVDAPGNSPNTDGVHIGQTSKVSIIGATIKTGDDCVSLGDGVQDVHVEKVTCGPGHGLAIGSLGKYPNEKPVLGVTVKNCTLTNTLNGARIKTWPGSPVGSATNMHFEDIIMNNVSNPILIDQQYCPWNQCKAGLASKVKLSGIGFKNIKGTSSSKMAMKIDCSPAVPCQGVVMNDINLIYKGKDGSAVSKCTNVKPSIIGKVVPAACSVHK
ncbi:PREDICTED: exopolygalacturonase clone GBGA483-like [Ipomoea nil]|uniref:exopolygalacturonase clone GBGA483-like n=1 Tax=Ipomoea nil TaxID=35883 RepID=UPI0009009357|nr:PREDICTED: exopolygalacturonase clone GBGA483-like [Ipomoea nil]